VTSSVASSVAADDLAQAAAPLFQYRYVHFGTVFSADAGVRGVDDPDSDPATLYANEVAVDVGGTCLGCDQAELTVIDHHFFRAKKSSPAASCAVIHHAHELQKRFAGQRFQVIWIVAHREPDFDSYAAMYLVRWILSEHPDMSAWDRDGVGRGFDWFEPQRGFAKHDAQARAFFDRIRWALILASYAAYIDNARRVVVSREGALHSLLYAALLRGRPFTSRTSGAVEMFDEARQNIMAGRDPRFDVVLDREGRFAPEFALLDREIAAYARDLHRARSSIVFVPTPAQHPPSGAGEAYVAAFAQVIGEPLLDDVGHLRGLHRSVMGGGPRRPFDGIYLRDPECLLFKEWARLDVDSSSMHRGFTFTCVAYSNERSANALNTSNYFVALDPEFARDANLYVVWAKLQEREVEARRRLVPVSPAASAHRARPGFEGRAGNDASYFVDPWYDAPNYHCTLVATPTHGTYIDEAGRQSDLSDDSIVALVRSELESWVFAEPYRYCDFPAVAAGLTERDVPLPDEHRIPVGAIEIPQVGEHCYRFCTVKLRGVPTKGLDLSSEVLTTQIGTELWSVLHPDAGTITPEGLRLHLFRHGAMLGVWSRAGVAIAWCAEDDAMESTVQRRIERLRRLFGDICRCARRIDQLVSGGGPADPASTDGDLRATAARVAEGDAVMRQIAATLHDLSLPEGRLLNEFVDEMRLVSLAQTLQDLNTAKKLDEQNEKLGEHMTTVADVQTKVEWLELLFVGTYATELGHTIAEYAAPDKAKLFVTLAISSLLLGIATAFLRPWSRSREGIGLLLVFGLIIGLALGVGAMQMTGSHWPPGGWPTPHA
jgi:hypothetical protein